MVTTWRGAFVRGAAVVVTIILVVGLSLLLTGGSAVSAESPAPSATQAPQSGVGVPGFWDPRRRPQRPDLSRVSLVRFMTEMDNPPFDYVGQGGHLAGFNVDLARMICEELKVACTLQMRRFDTLFDSLAENRGDAAIASIAVTSETRKHADFSDPYYRPVARFVALRDSTIEDVIPENVEGKKIAVVAGTAHEAYLKALFTEAEIHPYPTAKAAREALRRKEVDFLFGNGYALAFWLNGADSEGCCVFRGGPFTESRYFGEGVGIAVKRGNDTLRRAFNWALFQLWEKGRFTDLWLRYFPVNPF